MALVGVSRSVRDNETLLINASIDAHSNVGVIELRDSSHFNALGLDLACDLATAIEHLSSEVSLHCYVLQAAGPHFCIGGYPYGKHVETPVSTVGGRLLVTAQSCCKLRELAGPVITPVHGHLAGGGIALCLNTSYLISESSTTFEHGNLLRGVCPIGDFSQTLIRRVGAASAASIYMADTVLSALGALHVGLTHEACNGVGATKQRALQVVFACAQFNGPTPVLADWMILSAEAIGHAESRLLNGGEAKAAPGPPSDTLIIACQRPERPGKQLGIPIFSATSEQDALDRMNVATDTVFVAVVFRMEHNAVGTSADGEPWASMTMVAAMHNKLHSSSLLTVAVCEGTIGARALHVPCCAEIVLAHEDASFTFGAIPNIAIVAAQRRVPRSVRELICTGNVIGSARARTLGLVEMVGGKEEMNAEAKRLKHGLQQKGKLLLKRCGLLLRGHSQCAVEHSTFDPSAQVRLGLAEDSSLAMIELGLSHGLDSFAGLDIAVDWLSRLGTQLRAVTIGIGHQDTQSLHLSERGAAWMKQAISELQALHVPVVCYANAQMQGPGLSTWHAADYRISGPGAIFTVSPCERASQNPSAKFGTVAAQRCGVTSQVSSSQGSAEEHATQFGAWLAHHPTVGLIHMLALTRSKRDAAARSRNADPVTAWVKLGLLHSACTSAERKLELLRHIAMTEGVHSAALLPFAAGRPYVEALTNSQPKPWHSMRATTNFTRHKSGTSAVQAAEAYVPRHCVSAAALERANGCLKRDSQGMLVERCVACGDDEDTATMAFTVTSRLLRRCGVHQNEVGKLQIGFASGKRQIGCASLLDRSKSMKSELMPLLAEGDIEGVDHYGDGASVSALLDCVEWAQGKVWDGR
jgi:enoyl-CoA hydratase/carnithine racemase